MSPKDNQSPTNTRENSNINHEKPPARRKTTLFEYPALPKWEITAYIIIISSILSYGWYRIYQAGHKKGWNFKYYAVVQHPILGQTLRDDTNYEYYLWHAYAWRLLPLMIGHCLVFNLTPYLLGHQRKGAWEAVTFTYSFVAVIFLLGRKAVAINLSHGLLIFISTKYVRFVLTPWVIGLTCLVFSLHSALLFPDMIRDLGCSMFLSYGCLSYIGYSLEYLRGRHRQQDNTLAKQLMRMFYKNYYLPYMSSLIVLSPDFEQQLETRDKRPRKWLSAAFFAVRIFAYYQLWEFALHLFYHEAILTDKKYLTEVPLDTLAALGYAAGQSFHLKYTLIFGFGAVFARFDNMIPPELPICTTRVALYSKVWRYFDRGLYSFFKEYIFLPVCRPTFSLPRKILGVFISYAFVLAWHGTSHAYIVWIVVNVVELFIESAAKAIYAIPAVKQWREMHLSDRNFRRLLGWLQIVPFAIALYSNFYFLAGSMAGRVFVDRLLIAETLYFKPPALLLYLTGYFYNQSCMESERHFSEENKQQEREEEKKKFK